MALEIWPRPCGGVWDDLKGRAVHSFSRSSWGPRKGAGWMAKNRREEISRSEERAADVEEDE
eukprot:5869674-Pyramimonas_sp.AAC.1